MPLYRCTDSDCMECVKAFGPRADTSPEVMRAAAKEVVEEAAQRIKPLTDMFNKIFGR